MQHETSKEIAAYRIFVDEDNNCGVFKVKTSLAEYRVAVAKNGRVTLTGAGAIFNTSRAALRAEKYDLLGLAILAALTWEHSPTGGSEATR